jgi:transglutaminase-like putative cysteine protease
MLGTQKMTYDLIPGVFSYFPLQLGNGEYTVKIYEEVAGTGKYMTIYNEDVDVYIPDERLIYTASITNIYWTREMAAIVFAYDRTKDASYEWEMVARLYRYIVENYRYNYDKMDQVQGLSPEYIPDVEIIFHDKKLICYDYSVLFASMLRSLEIPVKLVTGYSTQVDGYHAWNEVFNPETGKWVVMDLTADAAYHVWGMDYEMEKDPANYDIVYIY